MGVGDWYREKKEAQSEYGYNRISREKDELRAKFAIGMIYNGQTGFPDGIRR